MKTTNSNATEPTAEDFQEARRLLEEVKTIYYGVSEVIGEDEVLVIQETRTHPMCIVCHPDNVETIREQIKSRGYKLKHLKDMSEETSLVWAKSMLKEYIFYDDRNPLRGHDPLHTTGTT